VIDEGLGRDIWMLHPDQISQVLFYYWVSAYLYIIIMHGTKISILLLYLRLFPATASRWFHKACWILIGLLIAGAVSIVISNAIACTPVNYYWLRWDGQHE
jgi:hypothetical protein